MQAALAQSVQEAVLAQRDLLQGVVVGEAGDGDAARLDGGARLVDDVRAPARERLGLAGSAVVTRPWWGRRTSYVPGVHRDGWGHGVPSYSETSR